MTKDAPQETPEKLEHDAARLHREVEILEGNKKAIGVDITAKRKELTLESRAS